MQDILEKTPSINKNNGCLTSHKPQDYWCSWEAIKFSGQIFLRVWNESHIFQTYAQIGKKRSHLLALLCRKIERKGQLHLGSREET